MVAAACAARRDLTPTDVIDRRRFRSQPGPRGFVWFFPAVDEQEAERRSFDRVAGLVPNASDAPFWFAPVRVATHDAHNMHAAAGGYGPDAFCALIEVGPRRAASASSWSA